MSLYSGGILALDLATVTGWAYGEPGKKPVYGHLRFAAAGSSHALTYRCLRAWLNDWIIGKGEAGILGKPSLVVFESAAVPMVMQGRTNAQTIKLLIGMCEHVEELCYDRVECREAMASQVRSHFVGTNRNKREEAKRLTIERCQQLGWDVQNDNQADACALWSYQVCALRPDIAPTHSPLLGGRRVISSL